MFSFAAGPSSHESNLISCHPTREREGQRERGTQKEKESERQKVRER
jgi:hypothetical protein